MATLTATPTVLNISAYAGDTLTISVTAKAALIGGRAWNAQLRLTHASPDIVASFVITPPAVADGPAFLVLPAAVTATLAGWVGVWDAQWAPVGGGDPTTTFARGAFTVAGDVTRLPS